MSNSIYLDLTGFIFKITFKVNIQEIGVTGRDKFKNEIGYIFSNCIIRGKIPSKIDLYVDIYDPNLLELIHEKNSNRVYQLLFTVVSENRIATSIQINIHQFRMILWNYYSKFLNKNKGFVLHSSGVSVGGNAFLFLGHSGAGKSTAARLLSKYYPQIADDTGVLCHEKKQYYYFSLPLPEKVSWIRRDNTRYNMGKVFFVKKSKEFKIEKIIDKEVVLKKFINQGFTSDDTRSIMPYILDFVSSFSDFYYLYFDKNAEKLYELIRDVENE